MPRKVRDYRAEYIQSDGTPARKKARAARNKARREMEAANGAANIPANVDVDHIKPISKGGTTTKGNLRLRSAHANRSYKRTAKGAIAGKG
jgi:hypothetical protein